MLVKAEIHGIRRLGRIPIDIVKKTFPVLHIDVVEAI